MYLLMPHHIGQNPMIDYIQDMLNERRSMVVVLADMLVKYERNPSPPLAHTIELIQEEIELKKTEALATQGCW
jgi:hypothetical protein